MYTFFKEQRFKYLPFIVPVFIGMATYLERFTITRTMMFDPLYVSQF